MDFEQIQDIIIAGWKSQTLFTALELGVFEQLATGATTLTDLVEKCSLPLASGKKLVTACVALGLIDKQGLLYQNSLAVQDFLVRGKPAYVGDVALHVRDIMPLWNHLTSAVQENSNRWKQATGSEEGHFFSLYKERAALENFLLTMDLYSQNVAKSVTEIFDFSSHKKLLDLGGSTGIFGNILVEKFPHLKVAIFDLPQVCDITDEYISNNYHKLGSMTTIKGNFLEDDLPKDFDVIYLGWILHDWPPEIQMKILEKCHAVLPSGGILLATENLLNEDETGPLFTALLSLDMLVSTDGGGESTGSEYLERIQTAGFRNVVIKELPMRHLIIGTRT
jgi:4-hydroxy-2,2'-bipyrrole-5-carbaldehyde O-methyltransferase